MSRKDYILIANALRKALQGVKKSEMGAIGVKVAVSCIVAALKYDNPLFDGGKFEKAIYAHME